MAMKWVLHNPYITKTEASPSYAVQYHTQGTFFFVEGCLCAGNTVSVFFAPPAGLSICKYDEKIKIQ